ncbi:MAG: glycosyltransferase [Flavobacteriales bacterium]
MKELWLFTTRFPFGFREAFLENELPVLCERFDRVLIFPENRDGEPRTLPANAEVRVLLEDRFSSMSLLGLLRRWPSVLRLLRSLWKDAPSFAVLREQLPELRSRIAQLIHRAHVVEEELMPSYDPERVKVYAYWTHDWVTVLGLVQERRKELRFFSRAHGYDVYEEQNRDAWIPFRQFQLQHVGQVYCASRSAQEHLQRAHPALRSKFELAMLGTTDHGPGPYAPEGPLKVASCSFLIPRKRVLLFVEALMLTKGPVHWTHFGSGEEEAELRAAIAKLPPHVTVDLRGMVLNKEIINFYSTVPVDVFVHLSRLEGGVAIAVQEASSFGIPVIAADSGGVREIMRPTTGVLLSNTPSAYEVAKLLDGFRGSPMNSIAFREGVRNTWKAAFEAQATFNSFVDRIER